MEEEHRLDAGLGLGVLDLRARHMWDEKEKAQRQGG
jgi:hypothetical protein